MGTSASEAVTEVIAIIRINLDYLDRWCEHQYYYPFFSILVLKTLCCLGPPMPCERVFSKACFINSDRQCLLQSIKILYFKITSHKHAPLTVL